MGAAAQFFAERFDAHDTHLFAILVAEKREGTVCHGVLNAHHFGAHGLILADFFIHHRFDVVDVAGRKRSKMGKVKPKAVGTNERSILLHMRSE